VNTATGERRELHRTCPNCTGVRTDEQERSKPELAYTNRAYWHEQKRAGTKDRKKIDHNSMNPFPNFAQGITKELVSYPERIIAQFLSSLREISDRAKNTKKPLKTKIVDFSVLESIQSN
jgi:hypothetical protein